MKQWKASQAFQNNGPNFWLVNTGWKSPSVAMVEKESDAHLISAAPELLAALKKCLEDDAGDLEPETVHAAMEAIAKAEGKSK